MTSWRHQRSEPGRFWVRWSPRTWPGPDGLWIDLSTGALGRHDPGAQGSWTMSSGGPIDDVVLLPPVAPELAAERDGLARSLARSGVPSVVQVRAGDGKPKCAEVVVLDGLGACLGDDAEPPPAEVLAWPLAPGLRSDGWLEVARACGASVVQGVPLDLDPKARRRVAECLGDETGLELFHGGEVDLRRFTLDVIESGFAAIVPRPLPRDPLSGATALRVVGYLAESAELTERLAGPASVAQALRRAATWAEDGSRDLVAIARDGNLGVLPWLEPVARRLVEQASRGDVPDLLGHLRGGLVSGPDPAAVN